MSEIIDNVSKVKIKYRNKKTKKLIKAIKSNIGETLYYMAMYYYDNNDYENSLPLLLESLNKEYFESAFTIGLIYDIKNKIPEMIKYYTIAIDKCNCTKSMYNLGSFNEKTGNINAKMHYYKMASYYGDADSSIKVAEIYKDLKQYDNAISYFNEAIKQGNNSIYCHQLLGYTYEINNNYDKAMEQYKILIERGNLRAYGMMAQLSCKMGDINKAIEYFEKGVELKNIDCIYFYGEFLIKILNDEDKMLYYMKMCNDLGEKSAYIYVAEYFETVKKMDSAKEYWIKVVKNGNFNYKYKLTQLSLYYYIGDHYDKFNRDVVIFQNKCKYLSKIDKCPVCINDNIKCIPYDCSAHFICEECYIRVKDSNNKQCPVCRF
jgi:tetratricopeptide (TPR) repeat protein